MSYCPSQDWDRYADEEEKAARALLMSELQKTALHLLPAIMQTKYQNPLGTDPSEYVDEAYRMAARFLLRGLEYEQGLSTERHADRAVNAFWKDFEDLII